MRYCEERFNLTYGAEGAIKKYCSAEVVLPFLIAEVQVLQRTKEIANEIVKSLCKFEIN